MSVIDFQKYRDRVRRNEAEKLSRALHAAIYERLLQILREAQRRSNARKPRRP